MTTSTKEGERFLFISHSSRDTWVAKQIAREVRACGATPFLDEAVLLKKRDLVDLNDISRYFDQLRIRVAGEVE